MSLLARFDDGECRAWFAAVLAICAVPDLPRARLDARSGPISGPQSHAPGPASAGDATARARPPRT